MRSLMVKTLLAIAAAALPALAVATVLGMTLIMVVGGAKQELSLIHISEPTRPY